MLDVGWSELLLIGVVALIVIGPEDLPKLFHTLGRITSRARMMAREFTSAMEDAAKNSGVEEATKGLSDLKSLTSKKSLGLDALDRAATRFEQWDPKASIQNGGRAKAEADAAPKPANNAPSPAVAAPATAPASEPVAGTSPAKEETSRRRIAAVRRSDMKDH